MSSAGKTLQGPEPLLTIQECAALAQASVSTIRREIARGALRTVKVGRQIRVRLTDWESYLDGNRSTGPLAVMPAKRPRAAAAAGAPVDMS